jgi:uncharacterized peroxidase-related enzyme
MTTSVPHSEASFLSEIAEPSAAAQAMYQVDRQEHGYVMNTSRLWAHLAEAHDGIFDVLKLATRTASLSDRDRGILVVATAATLGDSYCALMWGKKLASLATADVSAALLQGADEPLDDRERALAQWARQVAAEPNAIRDQDVQVLRDHGYDETQILAITVYVALRIAFATVNDALGARPDGQLRETAPAPVLAAVKFGRPLATGHSS